MVFGSTDTRDTVLQYDIMCGCCNIQYQNEAKQQIAIKCGIYSYIVYTNYCCYQKNFFKVKVRYYFLKLNSEN